MDLMLFKEGFIVMVIGMGTVFVFLSIMIFAMEINSKLLKFIGKYFTEAIPATKPVKRKANSNYEEIALSIACAVNARG